MSAASFLPPVIILSGAFFLIRLRAFFIIHPIRTLGVALRGGELRESVRSLLLALSGTLGVGNILGVAVGISLGGAGSVFWMLLSCLFSSVLKFAEVLISSDTGGGIGMISVIRRTLGRIPSHLYTLLIILLSLTMGTALQASAVREAAVGVGIPYLAKLLPIPLTALTAAICIFGKRGIKNAVTLMIPAASIVYTLLCLSVIIPNARSIPSVTLDILTSAFSERASLGGISGFIFASGMREGFSVGLLSNEAGAGTSSLSHTSGECGNAFRGGVFGILEVFFDTAVLCTLTAFTILLGFPQYAQGVDITVLSGIFDDYCGRIGSQALLASVLLFAVSTTLCWYYYGRLSAERLFGKRALPVFGALFLISFAAGLIFDIPRLVPLTDTVLFLLTVISVSALIKSSDRICALSEEYLNISSRKPFRVIKASKGGNKEPSCDSSKDCPDAIR